MIFKYTIESVRSIVDDIKLWGRIFKYMSLVFTTAYFIYVLCTGVGNVVVNAVLAVLFVCYTLFELITAKKNCKTARRVVKRSYAWIKIGIKTFTLGATIYGIYTATTAPSGISIILATLMIIMWVLQVLLELISGVVESKIDLVAQAWEQDVADIKQTVTAPVTAVSNAIRKLRGQEPVEQKPKSKKILFLEKKIEKRKTLKAKQKEELKLAKEEQKEELRLARLQQKQELKNQKAEQKEELKLAKEQRKEEMKLIKTQFKQLHQLPPPDTTAQQTQDENKKAN